MANKFSYLFDPKEESSKLTLIYCRLYDTVRDQDRDKLMEAYLEASDIAERRELQEAESGLLR